MSLQLTLLSRVTMLHTPQQTDSSSGSVTAVCVTWGISLMSDDFLSPEVLRRNESDSVGETALGILVLNTKVRRYYCHYCHVTNTPTAMNHALDIRNATLAPA